MPNNTEGMVFTHRGRRKRNEDNGRITRISGNHVVAIVCDGMGGHLAGDYASAEVTSAFSQALMDGEDPVQALEAINHRLYREAQADPNKAGMGTTLVAAILKGGEYTFLNVGDSRGYLLHENGRLQQITRDHSYVEEAIAAGELTREMAASSSYKNALTRAMATDATVRVDVFGPYPMPHGATLILCTDGVYKALDDARMADILGDTPEELLPSLAVRAFEAGSDDNTTAAALWLDTGDRPRASAKSRAKAAEKAEATLEKLAAGADKEREQRQRGGTMAPPPTGGSRWRARAFGGVLSIAGIGLIGVALMDTGAPNSGPPAPQARTNAKTEAQVEAIATDAPVADPTGPARVAGDGAQRPGTDDEPSSDTPRRKEGNDTARAATEPSEAEAKSSRDEPKASTEDAKSPRDASAKATAGGGTERSEKKSTSSTSEADKPAQAPAKSDTKKASPEPQGSKSAPTGGAAPSPGKTEGQAKDGACKDLICTPKSQSPKKGPEPLAPPAKKGGQ